MGKSAAPKKTTPAKGTAAKKRPPLLKLLRVEATSLFELLARGGPSFGMAELRQAAYEFARAQEWGEDDLEDMCTQRWRLSCVAAFTARWTRSLLRLP